MDIRRTIEYVFFFGLLGFAGYLVWLITAPFLSALALAAVIVTICHPLYERIRKITPWRNKSIAAFLSTLFVFIVIVLPLVLVSSLVVRELVGFYESINSTGDSISVDGNLDMLQAQLDEYLPNYNIDLREQIQQTAEWLTGNLGAIFAGTISTIFAFFIALIGSFYFFRDGRELLEIVIKVSPLPDHEDEIILARLAQAIRSVAAGTVLVAIIQGSLAAIGFAFFGIERAILLGSIGSLGALVPGVGVAIVTVPAIIYLLFVGQLVNGIGLMIWSFLVVGLVDNFIGPYLMSRGNNMHPFIILLAVLGGIVLFGPIGFIIGPVVITLFMVLLEIYNQYIVKGEEDT